MLRGNLREKAWNALMNHSPVDLKWQKTPHHYQ
jgi:hypothetical protein